MVEGWQEIVRRWCGDGMGMERGGYMDHRDPSVISRIEDSVIVSSNILKKSQVNRDKMTIFLGQKTTNSIPYIYILLSTSVLELVMG